MLAMISPLLYYGTIFGDVLFGVGVGVGIIAGFLLNHILHCFGYLGPMFLMAFQQEHRLLGQQDEELRLRFVGGRDWQMGFYTSSPQEP